MDLIKAELGPATILLPPMAVMIVRRMAQLTVKPKDVMRIHAQVSQARNNDKLQEILVILWIKLGIDI